MVKYDLTLFARSLGTLLGNGVPLIAALNIATQTVANLNLRHALENVIPKIKGGGKMVDAFKAVSYTHLDVYKRQALSKLDADAHKIITVEEPVEYQLAGINQIQVHQQIGLSFASALRSILRQDPDIIMIGEMRDTETAQIAVQSALTGHLVLSTLHLSFIHI